MIARPATDEEALARHALTAPVWGDRLDLERYFERERRLLATPFARRAMRSWVLEHEGEVVASCETYRMPVELDGRSGTTNGIASVFVEERLRGHGYAARLLARLRDEVFRRDGAFCSHLFSEVGAGIYGRIGYRARPIHGREWTPSPGDPAAVARVFRRDESADLLAPRFAATPPGGRRFRIVLDDAQLDWHRERAAFYHGVLSPDRPPPDAMAGAIAGEAWIAWSGDYRKDRLMVLAACPGTAAENEALVEATRRACRHLGLPVAELWESPAIRLPGGATVPRDDEIPMLLPLVEALAPEDWVDYGRGCWI